MEGYLEASNTSVGDCSRDEPEDYITAKACSRMQVATCKTQNQGQSQCKECLCSKVGASVAFTQRQKSIPGKLVAQTSSRNAIDELVAQICDAAGFRMLQGC